jgi:hypothetical protein
VASLAHLEGLRLSHHSQRAKLLQVKSRRADDADKARTAKQIAAQRYQELQVLAQLLRLKMAAPSCLAAETCAFFVGRAVCLKL